MVSEPTLAVTGDVCVLVTRAYGAWRVWTRVWSHGMACVPVLYAWMTVLRGKFLVDCSCVCRYVADEDVGSFRGSVSDISAQQG